jgi:hypothetical protein
MQRKYEGGIDTKQTNLKTSWTLDKYKQSNKLNCQDDYKYYDIIMYTKV